jgi:hypothetical protein
MLNALKLGRVDPNENVEWLANYLLETNADENGDGVLDYSEFRALCHRSQASSVKPSGKKVAPDTSTKPTRRSTSRNSLRSNESYSMRASQMHRKSQRRSTLQGKALLAAEMARSNQVGGRPQQTARASTVEWTNSAERAANRVSTSRAQNSRGSATDEIEPARLRRSLDEQARIKIEKRLSEDLVSAHKDTGKDLKVPAVVTDRSEVERTESTERSASQQQVHLNATSKRDQDMEVQNLTENAQNELYLELNSALTELAQSIGNAEGFQCGSMPFTNTSVDEPVPVNLLSRSELERQVEQELAATEI